MRNIYLAILSMALLNSPVTLRHELMQDFTMPKCEVFVQNGDGTMTYVPNANNSDIEGKWCILVEETQTQVLEIKKSCIRIMLERLITMMTGQQFDALNIPGQDPATHQLELQALHQAHPQLLDATALRLTRSSHIHYSNRPWLLAAEQHCVVRYEFSRVGPDRQLIRNPNDDKFAYDPIDRQILRTALVRFANEGTIAGLILKHVKIPHQHIPAYTEWLQGVFGPMVFVPYTPESGEDLVLPYYSAYAGSIVFTTRF